MPILGGGHHGQRGHSYGESEGVAAVARDSEGFREGDKAGKGGRDSFAELSADWEVGEASQGGGGPRDRAQIPGEAFQPEDG